MIHEPEWDDDFDSECDCCDGEGCPMCKDCGGSYACGSEECDWCEFSDECGAEYMRRFG